MDCDKYPWDCSDLEIELAMEKLGRKPEGNVIGWADIPLRAEWAMAKEFAKPRNAVESK